MGLTTDYFFVACPDKDCSVQSNTFSTRLKEFCAELWNSTVTRKINNEIKIQPKH